MTIDRLSVLGTPFVNRSDPIDPPTVHPAAAAVHPGTTAAAALDPAPSSVAPAAPATVDPAATAIHPTGCTVDPTAAAIHPRGRTGFGLLAFRQRCRPQGTGNRDLRPPLRGNQQVPPAD